MSRAVPAIEEAFAAHGRGEAIMPAKVYLSLDEYDGDFRAMPSYLAGAAGVKWVNAHPHNPERHGLPSVMGVYILSDPATAVPLAIMDATWLTAVRTGAAGAVASKHLAVGAPRSIGFIGCGVQARVLLSAHRVVFDGELELRMADASAGAASAFADEAGGKATSIEEAAACDIVCTATPSRSPIVLRDWVPAGTHVNAMGADAPGKQELEASLLTAGLTVIDDHHQAVSSGEVNVPIASGQLSESDIYGTLGEIVAGKLPGRRGDEITVFDSTGLAIQDVALATVAVELARERDIGLQVDFVA